ncbi:MAG TPA: helix-turn-helix domain-containing protein [Candidatus Brachybacterium merdigallinarum]|nr:helix-turn-helix domain-containing protein [Candidatus Brachybacterium merdigallinarum]
MSDPQIDAALLELRAERLVEDRDQLMTSLIALRREHELTQKQVAERMGVSQPTVAAFEHYDSNPTLATIQRYAMAVGAVLETHVIDDCGEGVPSAWSPPLERAVQLPVARRTASKARFSEPNYV